jgi:hypothetical protein
MILVTFILLFSHHPGTGLKILQYPATKLEKKERKLTA